MFAVGHMSWPTCWIVGFRRDLDRLLAVGCHGCSGARLSFLTVLAIQESWAQGTAGMTCHSHKQSTSKRRALAPCQLSSQQHPQQPMDGPSDFLKSWVWHACTTRDARHSASMHFKCPQAAEIRTPEPSEPWHRAGSAASSTRSRRRTDLGISGMFVLAGLHNNRC